MKIGNHKLYYSATAAMLSARSVQSFPVVLQSSRTAMRRFASVTGSAYESDLPDAPTVKLFTKEGCTLCDKVKDVLRDLQEEHPHSLYQVDITDEDHSGWFSKYKYDIPVLHLDDKFWIKHRITVEQAIDGLEQAKAGTFEEQAGDPDAGELERRHALREESKG